MKRRNIALLVLVPAVCVLLLGGALRKNENTGNAWNISSDGDKTELKTKTIGDPDDDTYTAKDGEKVIYLAGGCFWGMEKLYAGIEGVKDVTSGYANGDTSIDPDYENVCGGKTGYRETVRVTYDPEKVSLDRLIFSYFYVIDPTVKGKQGYDSGDQYQTGIYYTDKDSEKTVMRYARVEEARNDKFYVEIEPLTIFREAEEYHQDYLVKNPGGYCHVTPSEIYAVQSLKYDPADYSLPPISKIKKMLTAEQYRVTQKADTEKAFHNEYWDKKDLGIYVDRVTGEPLFFSKDKFDSSCGWPSFSKPIDTVSIVKKQDNSYGMSRTEVLSRIGNTHLGHVFSDDEESPNGTRYCMNSASLKFIPYDEMSAKGYGYLKFYVK